MTMTQSATMSSIERHNRPSYSEFVERFLLPRKAAIITGALDQWKAVGKWTPQYFKERYGSMPLKPEGQYHTLQGFMPAKRDGEAFTMSEFIDLIISSSDEKPAPYLRNVWVEKFLPELDADLDPLPEYFSPNWLDGAFTKPLYPRLHGGHSEFYIGGRGGKFPTLHYDSWHIHTFLCQIYGVKEYTILAPDQGRFLYPSDYHTSSIRDPENVDLGTFPLFAQATPIRFKLQPGEILFVPAGWWHTQKMLTPSITISVSRVNSSNWKEFSRELRKCAPPHVRPFVWTYLTGLRVSMAMRGSDNPKRNRVTTAR
ncbi:MAG TPA: cupin-like domain-containing protein [Terriglobia bacterium]|nr:cupin-like domain-containing protein [Terriglobia bacterium]